jgi:three-Cys-motif partner protein
MTDRTNAPRVSADSFFEESKEQSAVKTAIVSKYFWSWAKVIMPQARKSREPKIAYLDLFAGPGLYRDGTKSTPLLILEKAVEDEAMSQMLVTIFNDKDDSNARDLQSAINQLPGIEKLKYKPIVWSNEVGSEMVKLFSSTRLVPTLFFVDPWGYKGLSLQLVNSVLKDWGCDCVFFFNYNRINMGINNPMVQEHMAALFGDERAQSLRGKLEGLSKEDREAYIVEELCKALDANRGRYVLPFSFKNDAGTRTSHHLIFVSKSVRGYTIMKDIMWKESSSHNQGVATFEYSPADKRFPLLFELLRPLDELEGMLLAEFAGQKLTMRQVFDRHQIGRPFVSANYKEVLKQMESKRLVRCSPDSTKRRKNTLGDDVTIVFPPTGGSFGKVKH